MPQDYKCPLCQITLGSQKEFTSHIRGHNEVKPSPDPNDPTGQAKVYYCCLCGKMLSSFSSLDRHMLVHSGERPFSCELCGQTFTTNGNMHRHKRTHGARESRDSDGSSGTSSTGGSQKSKVGRKRKSSPDQIHSLTSIASPPLSSSFLEASKIAQINSKKAEGRASGGLLTIPNLTGVTAGHAKCPVCHESFFSEISLAAHVDSAHRGQDIQCDECSNIFPGYSYLKLHKNIYHHKSLASFPLQALQQGLNSFSPVTGSTGTQHLRAEHSIDAKENIPTQDTKKEENILDLSAPLKSSKSIIYQSNEDLSNNGTSEFDQDYDKEFDDNEDLIRDMKLKGEFPCRICPAVYPNLRALKGHNKEHMDKPPYICNVAACTYSSNDKSTLARHMRTHTGEKPFECTLCNFGFTTKANCERHIKNKHGKLTREEVRDAIVVHEVTDDKNSSSGERHLNTSLTESNLSNSSYRDESPNGFQGSPTKKRRKSGSVSSEKRSSHTLFAPYHSSLFRPASVEKKLDHDETPLDLSRPIGDIPMKKDDFKKQAKKDLSSFDLSSPLQPFAHKLPSPGGLDFSKSLAAAATFPTLHNQVPFPFLFSHFASAAAAAAGTFDLGAYLLAQQENLRRQQELEAAAAAAAAAAAMGPKDATGLLLHLSNLQSLSARNNFAPDLPIVKPIPTPACPISPSDNGKFSYFQEANKEKSDSESDYKMVIKNGVLMKKQKQRRYRTERPYECEKCNARFTLRSNMERHVKQQHAGGNETMANGTSAKDSDKYGREDDDRDEMEDSENDESDAKSLKMNIADEDEEINVQDDCDEDEDEEEGIDLSNLEQIVLRSGCQKPFSLFFDNMDDDDDEVHHGDEDEHSDDEKKSSSAYASAPNKIPCPYCGRKFPWLSSLKRHILTHTGAKPYKCPECPLWFTTKSNCDRHLARKHSNNNNDIKNVPERPFKCSMCPSSTFSSLSKLCKHQHFKHNMNNLDGFSSASSNEEDEHHIKDGHNDSKDSNSSGLSETPFKCHICEEGFCDREEAVAHLKKSHEEAYQILMAKGAFDSESQSLQSFSYDEENFDQLRGKFPDYVNRKVVCMFCMRKFWSAEDLRRHVRTHTGERPYSCDICQRTFTLKHSMLRHRKKHDSGVSSGGEVSESESEHGSNGEVRSTYTSSVGGGRSSPEEESAKTLQIQASLSTAKLGLQKKRANLMDKINQLSSCVNLNSEVSPKV